jgi:hypothetical protein
MENLQHFAKVATVLGIYYGEKGKEKLKKMFQDPQFWTLNYYERDVKVQEIAGEQIDLFDMPESIKKSLKKDFVPEISCRILRWTNDAYEDEERDYFSVFEKLRWTQWGTLNLRATAKSVTGKEPIVIQITL